MNYRALCVCEWIDNSKLIAQENYLRVTDINFDKAQQQEQQSSSSTDCPPKTDEPKECENPRETEGLVAIGQSSSIFDESNQWSLLDSKQPVISAGKGQVSGTGAVKSAAVQGDSFSEAVIAIMALPLTPAEKADAVRRLLGENREGGGQ